MITGPFTVEDAYCNQGTNGQRSESAAYLLNFLRIQLTSTLADQYSVLREWLLIGAAALTVEGISVESAGCGQGACGQCPEPAAYLHDFVLIQITSALAS